MTAADYSSYIGRRSWCESVKINNSIHGISKITLYSCITSILACGFVRCLIVLSHTGVFTIKITESIVLLCIHRSEGTITSHDMYIL